MARALLLGCGCRARALGAGLAEAGWAVRGSTRDPQGFGPIEAAGIEPVRADPDRVGTVLAHVGDVGVLAWLLGSATGSRGRLEALHDHRLERTLEKLVDTPVRGFVYEAAGSVDRELLERGASLVDAASERWRIPSRVVRADPDDHELWLRETRAAIESLIA